MELKMERDGVETGWGGVGGRGDGRRSANGGAGEGYGREEWVFVVAFAERAERVYGCSGWGHAGGIK